MLVCSSAMVFFQLYLVLLSLFIFGVDHANSKFADRSTYIIYMERNTKPATFSNTKSWYRFTIKTLKAVNESFSPSLLYSYESAFDGFCASLSLHELEILKNSPGFISFYKDEPAILHTTHTTKFMSLNPFDGIWPKSSYGEDIIVGVIDSGIWPESLSFKDQGMTSIPSRWQGKCAVGQEFDTSMCNSKLIGARYFKKGLLANIPKIKISMNSARDTAGHGTAVSSILGGNNVSGASYFGYAKGEAIGVAPHARIAMYKVGWDEGLYTSDIVAGFDKAILDKVDIISMSLGPGRNTHQIYENPVAKASFAATSNDVLVVMSAGNDGPSLWTVNNDFPWVLTVGAGTIDRALGGTLYLGNGTKIIGWTLFPSNTIIQDLPIFYDKTISTCSSVEMLSRILVGIIICEQSTNVFDQISNIVSSSNVRASIFISNDPELLQQQDDMPCPSVVISPNDASVVIEYVTTTHQPRASIKFRQTILGIKPAPTASYSSSRGPSQSFPNVLKPDVIAPGTIILAATVPTVRVGKNRPDIELRNDFAIFSGTSMACPQATGVAVLLKEVYRDWSPAAIRSAILTTANPFDNTYQPIQDSGLRYVPASPFAIGAGHIDPNRALDPGLIYDASSQDYINLLCSTSLNKKQLAAIIGSSSYDCSNASSDLNYPSFVTFYNARARFLTRRKFRRTVTNVKDGPVTYKAHLTAPKGFDVRVSPTSLTFGMKNEKKDYTLTINHNRDYKRMISYGELSWIEQSGQVRVRSPIVVYKRLPRS